ncbi:MAG: glycosyltransferase [Planctomycetota bacterium]
MTTEPFKSGAPPRMKIALVIPTMDWGGAEKQVVLLADGLHRRGHDVRVFLLTRDGPRSQALRDAGVHVVLIGKRFKGDVSALFRLTRTLRHWSPDLVHTFLFAANSFGRLAAIWANVPVILGSERCVDSWKQGWHFWVDRRLQSRTDRITTNSSGVVEFYSNHGIDPGKFVVIPNGIEPIDTDCMSMSRRDALASLNVQHDHHLILAVGRLWPQKRVRNLIWAAELLGTLREDTTLVLIGDGPQRDELLRHRDAVSRPGFVRFAGWRDDVAALLPHADAFWIASEDEGQSNAVIEAMRAGVPVIASNIPGNRDLIEHETTGWLFELGDEAEIARLTNVLLNDPGVSAPVVTAAQNRIAEQFDVELMVDRHLSLYEKQLDESKR